MSENDTALPERITASYKRLAESAKNLNTVSDQLGKTISTLDDALKKLNLGVSTWVKLAGHEDDYDGSYWSRDLGYDKIGREWGIALRTTHGNCNYEDFNSEEWLFNDAPRSLRIEAVEKLPELIDQLITSADDAAKKIKEKTAHAQKVAAAIQGAIPPRAAQRK